MGSPIRWLMPHTKPIDFPASGLKLTMRSGMSTTLDGAIVALNMKEGKGAGTKWYDEAKNYFSTCPVLPDELLFDHSKPYLLTFKHPAGNISLICAVVPNKTQKGKAVRGVYYTVACIPEEAEQLMAYLRR